jgi:hypothetical protein
LRTRSASLLALASLTAWTPSCTCLNISRLDNKLQQREQGENCESQSQQLCVYIYIIYKNY